MQNGAIWLIDDDKDDHDMVGEVFKELKIPNELVFFSDGPSALQRLAQLDEAPFIIICDVNLPKMSGFELRRRMLDNSSKKFHSVPFIFWSSAAGDQQITTAFDLSAHGFFMKGTNYSELKETFSQILSYWQESETPPKSE